MNRIENAAHKVAAQLEKLHYTEDKPIVRKYENGFEVIWEAGPFEWTLGNYGLFEELKSYGMPGDYESGELFSVPKGYGYEPINSYSIAVYKD